MVQKTWNQTSSEMRCKDESPFGARVPTETFRDPSVTTTISNDFVGMERAPCSFYEHDETENILFFLSWAHAAQAANTRQLRGYISTSPEGHSSITHDKLTQGNDFRGEMHIFTSVLTNCSFPVKMC